MVSAAQKSPIAFFCAEFGIDSDLPTYSGGLGILSADIVQEAADQDLPMVGIGILYRGKHFMQHISDQGTEEKRDSEFDHDTSFLRPTFKDGKPLKCVLEINNEKVFVKPYQIRLSENVILYFLSTNVDGNPKHWITDMDALYHGDTESQIRQMVLLGVGGAKLLKELGYDPIIYHINEGRPSFCIWEIAKQILEEDPNKNFSSAWNQAIKKIVYTNHTLVPAGNPTYPMDVVKKYASHYAKYFGVSGNEIVSPGDDKGVFSLTKYALSTSSRHNSVSKLHNTFAKKQWSDFEWVNITNGVHMNRWQDSDFRNQNLSDEQIWDLHNIKKKELADTVLKRTGFGYDPNRLVITWARRLAEYKQPTSIFQNIERLKSMISNNNRPIQILYAGNSHSADPNAKSIIENIIRIFSQDLAGHAIFIPNYNISLANHLVSGTDVWLNTPKGNQEASGTSGMKASSNGVLSCTVSDGWVAEVDWDGIGWILDPKKLTDNFYEVIEGEVAPLFYERNDGKIPEKWVKRMRKSINLTEKFSTTRVLEEYKRLLWKIK